MSVYTSLDILDLPPFPTRRSSDLRSSTRRAPKARAYRRGRRAPFSPPARSECATRLACAGCADRRSEEHTSELQSLRHLVCRLLLEKKKKKKTNQNPENTRETGQQ